MGKPSLPDVYKQMHAVPPVPLKKGEVKSAILERVKKGHSIAGVVFLDQLLTKAEIGTDDLQEILREVEVAGKTTNNVIFREYRDVRVMLYRRMMSISYAELQNEMANPDLQPPYDEEL